jgi:hypothetical protein
MTRRFIPHKRNTGMSECADLLLVIQESKSLAARDLLGHHCIGFNHLLVPGDRGPLASKHLITTISSLAFATGQLRELATTGYPGMNQPRWAANNIGKACQANC